MMANEIRLHITAVPFKPFTLHVADGRSIPVHARDFILVSPLGSVVDVFQPNEEHDILDTNLITEITFEPPPSGSAATQQPQQTTP